MSTTSVSIRCRGVGGRWKVTGAAGKAAAVRFDELRSQAGAGLRVDRSPTVVALYESWREWGDSVPRGTSWLRSTQSVAHHIDQRFSFESVVDRKMQTLGIREVCAGNRDQISESVTPGR